MSKAAKQSSNDLGYLKFHTITNFNLLLCSFGQARNVNQSSVTVISYTTKRFFFFYNFIYPWKEWVRFSWQHNENPTSWKWFHLNTKEIGFFFVLRYKFANPFPRVKVARFVRRSRYLHYQQQTNFFFKL